MAALGVVALVLALAPTAQSVRAFDGVFWQPDCQTLRRLSDYRQVGATFMVVQWTQLEHEGKTEDYSGQGHSLCRLDWAEVQRRSGGLPLILGLKSQTVPTLDTLPALARESAALAEQLNLLSLRPQTLGYYAPVELNPNWPAEQVRAYLNALPRPLWVSAYAVPGQLGPDFVAWLKGAVPQDVHLMIQDGVGVHGFAPTEIAGIVRDLQAHFGKDGVSVVVEVFRPFPGRAFRSALPWELDRQLQAYRGLQTVAFDGGHYMSPLWQRFFRLYQHWRGLLGQASPGTESRIQIESVANGLPLLRPLPTGGST